MKEDSLNGRKNLMEQPADGRAAGKKFTKVHSFFAEDLWQTDLDSLPRPRRTLYYYLRILYAAVREFFDHQCLLLASALTYTTLLSLVPLLALMFSILKGLGVQNRLEPILLEKLSAGSEVIVSQIVRYIDRTNVKTLGALGLVGLIVTAISVIGNIEGALNKIWGVQKSRTLGRKFSDYLSILLTCPILIVAALGLTSSIQSATIVRAIPGASHLVFLLATLSPYLLLWTALTFVYGYLPNRSVPLRSAIFGGVIAGTLWQFAQWAYVHFQIGAGKYNAIYGAFAQLPIFLIWLYLGWAIVLFGAALSFTHQNIGSCRKEAGGGEADYAFTEELGLKLLMLIGKSFYAGTKPCTAGELCAKLNAPAHLVNELLHHHCQAGILLSAFGDSDEVYLLATAPENITIDHVIEAMRNYGRKEAETKKIGGDETLRKILAEVRESRRAALSHRTLKDLLSEARE